MIDKLVEYTSCHEQWGNYYETTHPTKNEIMDKINEIIDYLNMTEKDCAELIAEHEKKPAELISGNQPKTAKWVNAPYTNERICSNCEHKEPYKFADDDAKIYNYCPNCGAKMEN